MSKNPNKTPKPNKTHWVGFLKCGFLEPSWKLHPVKQTMVTEWRLMELGRNLWKHYNWGTI